MGNFRQSENTGEGSSGTPFTLEKIVWSVSFQTSVTLPEQLDRQLGTRLQTLALGRMRL
jgi:hypothetical protein